MLRSWTEEEIFRSKEGIWEIWYLPVGHMGGTGPLRRCETCGRSSCLAMQQWRPAPKEAEMHSNRHFGLSFMTTEQGAAGVGKLPGEVCKALFAKPPRDAPFSEPTLLQCPFCKLLSQHNLCKAPVGKPPVQTAPLQSPTFYPMGFYHHPQAGASRGRGTALAPLQCPARTHSTLHETRQN